MAELLKAFVEIEARTGKLEKELAGIKANTKKATSGMESAFLKVGVAIAATFATRAAIDFFSSATKSASDLQETTGKFKTVFGEQIVIANQLEKELVSTYATSTEEARRYLGAMQDLLVPMGVAPELAANLSGEVVKLSADLGSFNNLPTEDVMRDIQSALVGNFETMKKYGVVLNATIVKTKAMELGLANAKGEIGAAEKAQAALKLIMEGSVFAIGDMERTSKSYANQTKQLNASIADQQAALGQALLPAMTEVVGVMSNLTKAFKDNDSVAVAWLTTIGQATAGLALMVNEVFGVKTLLQEQGESALRVMKIQEQIASLGDSFLYTQARRELNTELKKEQANLAKIIKRRKDEAAISKRYSSIVKKEIKVRKDIGKTDTKVADVIKKNAIEVAKVTKAAVDTSLNAWGTYEEERREEDDRSFDNFFNNLKNQETEVADTTAVMSDAFTDAYKSMAKVQEEFLVGALRGDIQSAEQLWNSYADTVSQVVGTEISKIISESVVAWQAGENAKVTASTIAASATQIAWGLATAAMTLGISFAITAIINNFGKIKDVVTGIFDGIKGVFKGIANFFVDGFNIILDVVNWGIRAYNKVAGWLGKSGIDQIEHIPRFAKGGAFEGGRLVDTPTLFGFGGGKTGMAGEAGPEAIMPLSKNAQGELGVKSDGGGGGASVTINIQGNLIGDESTLRDFAEVIGNELSTLRGLNKVESLA